MYECMCCMRSTQLHIWFFVYLVLWSVAFLAAAVLRVQYIHWQYIGINERP